MGWFLIIMQNLPIVSVDLGIIKGVTKDVEKLLNQLSTKCHDLEEAVKAISNLRNAVLSESMRNEAIKTVVEEFGTAQEELASLKNLLQKILSGGDPSEEEEEELLELDFSSDSDSDILNQNNNKRSLFGSKEKYTNEDNFVASDSEELSVYDDPKYDEHFGWKLKKKQKLRRSSRKNKGKNEFYSDVPESEQYGDDPVEDLMEEEEDSDERANQYSIQDYKDCRDFIRDLRDGVSLKQAIKSSPWFQNRYQKILETVRDNLGLQGHNNPSLVLWDHIAEDAYEGLQSTPEITKGKVYNLEKAENICGFCNSKRQCTWKLELRGMFHPIGTKCGELVKSVIQFFFILREIVNDKDYRSDLCILDMDKALAGVQEAHAGKALR